MTLREIELLQGFPSGWLRFPPGVSEQQAACMLGNAFTVSVIGRIALRLLKTLGIVDDDACVDAWEAQASSRRRVVAEPHNAQQKI